MIRAAPGARTSEELDYSPVWIVRVNHDAIITHVNEAWCAFARDQGAGVETIAGVGLDYLEAMRRVCEESAAAVARAFAQLAAGCGDSCSLVYPCHSSTEVRWFRLEAKRVDEEGVVLSHTNVTEHHLAEARLGVLQVVANGLSRRVPLLDSCRDLMIATGEGLEWDVAGLWMRGEGGRLRCVDTWTRPGFPAGVFTELTRAAEFELDAGSLPGRVWLSKTPEWLSQPASSPGFLRGALATSTGLRSGCATPILGMAEGEVLAVIEFFSHLERSRDDQLLELLATAGQQLGTMAQRDRAEQRLAEAEAKQRESETSFFAIIEGLPDSVFVETDGKLVYANSAACNLLLYQQEELLGRSVRDLVHPEDREQPGSELRERPNGSGAEHWERRVLRKDGQSVWLDGKGVTIEFHGKPSVMVVARDTSAQRQLQERLLVSERMASVGTLAAGVAHEINNPLAYVIANLDFVARELPGAIAQVSSSQQALVHRGIADPTRSLTELQEVVLEAREGAERVRKVVRDLKTFSRPETEKTAPVQVNKVMESTINMAWNEIRHRARLIKDLGKTPPVLANESRLGQVLLNLVVNAAQALPAGKADENTIRVRTFTAGARVGIEIGDTGCGIPPESLRKIFDAFYTTKAVGQGTGLGLSICYKIVRDLGGEIEVESKVGQGTVFRVFLPVAPELVPAAASPLVVVPRPVHRGRILIVDDDALVGKSLGRMLGREHQVTVVTCGRDALASLASGAAYDVVFCDLMMPQLSGDKLHAEVLRSHPEYAARLVFMTGGAFTQEAAEFLQRVPNQRLEKPFTEQAVRAVTDLVLAA